MNEARMAGLAGVVATVWIGWAAIVQSERPAPLIGNLGPRVAALEARVSAQPEDGDALVELGSRYLQVGASGFARAALNRAPRQVLDEPRVADLQVRCFADQGEFRLALTAQERLRERCDLQSGSQHCSRTLIAVCRARRERLRASDGSQRPRIRVARLDLN